VGNREVMYRGMDGSDVWSLSTYEKAAWEGAPARLIWLFDITEEKANREALVIARDAAEAALCDLQRAQERLIQAEKMASLGQLTAGIAHEIKNPLNFVNNFASLSDDLLVELVEILEAPIAALDAETRDDAEDLLATIRENLGKINEHGRRADSIVKNMLLHSREGPSERQTVNLNPIADEALNLAYHGARAENPNFNIEMKKSLDPEVGAVECFAQDLMRVFLNLMTNGMYAAHKRRLAEGDGFAPAISLTTRAAGERVEIEVRDNGSGIPADIAEKIFMPFFTTKPAGEGTGLGLSLSYDIVVKQHGGALTVESKPGGFTAFRVSLPRVMPGAAPGTMSQAMPADPGEHQ
jgi:signal transduction histidine kinase